MTGTSNPEEILVKIGGCGRFQIALGFLMHLVKAPTVFSMYLMIFAIARPKWWCADDLVDYNVTMATEGDIQLRELAVYSTDALDPDRFKNCQYKNTTTCSKFIYDDFMNTVVSEWDMTCELSWVPSTIASMQMAGLLVGNMACGQLADTIGRKIPLYLSLAVNIIASLLGYFSTGWVMFAVARVLCGLGMGCFLTVQYSMLSETTLARHRPWVVGLPTWPLNACVFALVAYLVHDWRMLHIVAVVVTVPFLATWWFMPESFRWFLSHDRKGDARKVIQYIAKLNRHDISDDVTDAMLSDISREETGGGDHKKYTILHLFKTRRLAKITLLSILNWFVLGLVSYSITFGIQALSGNFFLNLFVFNIITLPLFFVAIWMCNRFGRRPSVILCFLIAATGCLVVGILQYIDTDYRSNLTSGFAMVASLGIGASWGPICTMTQELYPTVIRNISYGFLNMFARIGAMIAPQLAFWDTKVAGIMYFTCFLLCVTCVLGTLALTETRGRNLNDRIEIKVDKPETK